MEEVSRIDSENKWGLCLRSCRRNFTIVELLIVISIISILTAILLPALSKAKGTAMGIRCISNSRQIGTAQGLYIDSFNYYPPYSMGGADYTWASLYGGLLWNTDYSLASHYKKFTENCIFRCPVQIDWVPLKQATRTLSYISYGWNGALFGWQEYSSVLNDPAGEKKTSVKSGLLKMPSKTLVIGEGWNSSAATYEDKTYAVRHIGSNLISSPSATLAFRHQKRMTVLYGDGHVSGEPQRWIIRGNTAYCPWNIENKGLDNPSIGVRPPSSTDPYN